MPSGTCPLDWIVNADPRRSPQLLDQASRCLMDLVGVAAGATGTHMATHAQCLVSSQFGGNRPLLFTEGQASPAGVALHGGWLIDALDAHDGQVLTRGHAGVALLPGLLALPQTRDMQGHELLALLVVGYEIAVRAGIALHATSPDYHASGAWNALGVAAVAARVLGLDRERLHHALGIAEYHGPRSQMMRCIDHPTMVKDSSGWGAMTGITAALLAKDGFTGAPAVTVISPETRSIWQDLGERWYINEQYFKAWPVCRWAQPAVEATLSLRPRIEDSAGIELVEITTFHAARRLHVRHPETTEQAQYSLPWPVACVLIDGQLDATSVTRLERPDIHALADRVTIVESDDLNQRFPAERWASARIHLHGGRILDSRLYEARGDPHCPLGDEELISKYRALAEPVLGQRAEKLLRVIRELGERPASDLLDLLGPV